MVIADASAGLASEAEAAEARVVVGAATQGPAEMPLGLCYGMFVDAGEARSHQTVGVEAPVLVAVGAEPVAAVVAVFVGEPHRDAVAAKVQSSLIRR